MRKRLTIMPPWAHDYERGLLADASLARATTHHSLSLLAGEKHGRGFLRQKKTIIVLGGSIEILAVDGDLHEKSKRNTRGGARSRRKGSCWHGEAAALIQITSRRSPFSSHTIAPAHLLRGAQLISSPSVPGPLVLWGCGDRAELSNGIFLDVVIAAFPRCGNRPMDQSNAFWNFSIKWTSFSFLKKHTNYSFTRRATSRHHGYIAWLPW
jgi:hypothetical protein